MYIIILLMFISSTFSKTIVVTNHIVCTRLAKNILQNNGSLIDASINIMLCEGVVAPQDSGIGGGFYGIFKLNNTPVFLVNSREKTPIAIKHRSQIENKFCNIGIPGAIKGYMTLHKKFGVLPWKKIILPVLKVCRRGIKPNSYTYRLIRLYRFDKHYSRKFNKYYNKALCNTLFQLALKGGMYFYSVLSKKIIRELSPFNPYIKYGDFMSYKSAITNPSFLSFKNYEIYSTNYPAPGMYINKAFEELHNNKSLLEVLDNFYTNVSMDRYIRYKHRKPNKLYLGNRHSTSNICIKRNEEALCITSTINLYFGSGFYSRSTGIYLNNQLDDIPEYYTKIRRKTIPPTSISTSIIFKNNKINLILGGTGGNRIPSGIINVLYYYYILGYPLNKAISNNRIFYANNYLEIENGLPPELYIKIFKNINKQINVNIITKSSYNTVTGISANSASFDPRRGGLALYF